MKKNHCKVHGLINEETGYRCDDKTAKDGFRLRCKICANEKSALGGLNRKIRGLCELHGLAKNRYNNYTCQKCKNDRNRKYYNQDLDLARKKVREKRLRNKDRYHETEIIRQKGITREQYQQMFVDQDNKCAICNQPETRLNRSGELAKLCVDHCHRTLKVRSLLCHDCNTGIGKFSDNVELLQKAIDYLRKHEDGS